MSSTAQELRPHPNPTEALRLAMQALIDEGRLDLPMLPDVANQILASVRDERSDAAHLAQLIHQDQSIAAHLLQVANSPAFMGSRKIVSLQQAIARLGLRTISEITLAMVVKAQLFNVRGHEVILDRLWRHALASATWAREIARTLRYNVESAFLCGLLHEIGKPSALQALVDLDAQQGFGCGKDAIHELMDEFHIQVGNRLACEWTLPDPVCEAIAHYQDYDQARCFARDAMIVHCADAFATALIDEERFDEEALRELPVLSELNLYPDDVSALFGKIEIVEETVEALR